MPRFTPMFRFSASLASAAALSLAILLASSTTASAQEETLFERLGGMDALDCWVDEGVAIVAEDDRIADYFAGELNAGQALGLADSIVQFACAATGGPCIYEGRDMACAHAGLSVGDDAFTYFLEDMEEGAVACRRGNTGYLPDPAYSEFNKVLLSLRPPIVQDDPGENPLGDASCPEPSG